jgi:hypothetical protein
MLPQLYELCLAVTLMAFGHIAYGAAFKICQLSKILSYSYLATRVKLTYTNETKNPSKLS